MKKKAALLAAAGILAVMGGGTAAVLLLHGNAPEEQLPTDPAETAALEQVYTETHSETEEETMAAVPTDAPPVYPEVKLEVETVELKDVHLVVEAETARIQGNLMVEDIRMGASAGAYLTGFSKNPGDKVTAVFDIPSAQHYDVTVCVCGDAPATNTLTLNGEPIGDFSITEGGKFVRVTFSGVYLPAGSAELSVAEKDGNFCLDYFEISNFTEMYDYTYDTPQTLSDENASKGAQALMQLLCEGYGTKTITGQYASSPENRELELLYHLTGKYPAIRFAALEKDSMQEQVEATLQWAQQGGIGGLMWYWDAPGDKPSVFSKETAFSLKAAVTAEDVARKTPEELKTLLDSGKITKECFALIEDIDSMSGILKPLADADVPLLWRPLHEAGGGWFWWGRDGADAYRWLWDLMYARMTEYHGMHNLIWIWNGQSGDFLVDRYDIAAADIYLNAGENFGSRYEQYVILNRMTEQKKLLALSETSSVPDVNEMFRDNCIWSFFGLWYGEYLEDKTGAYSPAFTPEQKMIDLYNSEAVWTLEDVKGKVQQAP